MTIPIVRIPVRKFENSEKVLNPLNHIPQSHFPSTAWSIGNGNILHHIAIGGALKKFAQKTLPRSAMLCEAVPFSKPPGRVPVLCGRGTGTAVVPLRPAALPRTAQRDKWLGQRRPWDRGNGLVFNGFLGLQTLGICRTVKFVSKKTFYICLFGGEVRSYSTYDDLWNEGPQTDLIISILSIPMLNRGVFSQTFIFTTKNVLNLPFSNQSCWKIFI